MGVAGTVFAAFMHHNNYKELWIHTRQFSQQKYTVKTNIDCCI